MGGCEGGGHGGDGDRARVPRLRHPLRPRHRHLRQGHRPRRLLHRVSVLPPGAGAGGCGAGGGECISSTYLALCILLRVDQARGHILKMHNTYAG